MGGGAGIEAIASNAGAGGGGGGAGIACICDAVGGGAEPPYPATLLDPLCEAKALFEAKAFCPSDLSPDEEAPPEW